MKDRTAHGTAAVNLVPLAPNESITAIIATREFSPDQFLVFATAQGQVKKTAMSEYDKSRREGFIAINLRDGDELVRVVATSGHDDLFEVTRNGMTIRFNEEDVRPWAATPPACGASVCAKVTSSCRATWPRTTRTS